MRQTVSEHRRFHVPMHWRYAGPDLARSKPTDQRIDRSFIRSEGLQKSLLLASTLACANITCSSRPSVAPTIDVGAAVKSP